MSKPCGILIRGNYYTLRGASRAFNVSYHAIHNRYHVKGLRGEELIAPVAPRRTATRGTKPRVETAPLPAAFRTWLTEARP